MSLFGQNINTSQPNFSTSYLMTDPDELTIPMMNNMSAATVDTIGVRETYQEQLDRFNRLMATPPESISVNEFNEYMDYVLNGGTLPYLEYAR